MGIFHETMNFLFAKIIIYILVNGWQFLLQLILVETKMNVFLYLCTVDKNLKPQIMAFKANIFYKLLISTLRNKAEIHRKKNKTQLSEDHMLCSTCQTFKVLISASKSTLLHTSDKLKYHFLEENL